MQDPRSIAIEDYNYPLPQKQIAQFPMQERDQSRLLIYQNKQIEQGRFADVARHLPENSLLVFNETRVVQARMEFFKTTGARIEIFCLEPILPTREVQSAFQVSGPVVWKCFIGNAKKWKSGALSKSFHINEQAVELQAEKLESDGNAWQVKFSWTPASLTFATVLEHSGLVPLPPYMNRDAEINDKSRYQTIYARSNGSVAAPTAGLHFTDRVFQTLAQKGIQREYLTLHVGAGTFQPVSAERIADHQMHTEQIVVERSTLERLLKANYSRLIAVGTTTIRTLESLYWYGQKLVNGQDGDFCIHQWDPYRTDYKCTASAREALQAVLQKMNQMQTDVLHGHTQLLIAPAYQYRLVQGMITNFHQPKSTLLLLVAAFMGQDWKQVYQYALEHDFRFLSYGDSCLFL